MAMIGKIILGLCLLHLTATNALAGSLTGELDKSKGSLHDTFVYTLSASGSDFGGNPQFPKIEGLTIQPGGTSQNYTNINGQASRQIEYTFLLTPQREGGFLIPTLAMEVDGQLLKTLPLRLTVGPAPKALGEGDPKIFIERTISNLTPYVGEPVISKVRVYTRVRMANGKRNNDQPAGFDVIEIEKQNNYRKVFGNHEYQVIELTQILIPKQAGKVVFPPFRLEAAIPAEQQAQRRRRDPFQGLLNRGRMVRRTVVSEPAEFSVKALPSKGRPQDFSGAVGQFRLRSSLSTRSLKVGETATLTLTVLGAGTARGIREPLVVFDDSIKVYKDKPAVEENASHQGLRSKHVYKYALVPTKEGTQNLKSAKVWVFDTKTERYQALEASLGSLQIAPGSGAEAALPLSQPLGVTKKDVKVLGEDIIGVHRATDGYQSSGLSFLDQGFLWGFPAASLVFCGLGMFRRKFAVSADERHRKRRNSHAFKSFKKESQKVAHALKSSDIELGVQTLDRSFRTYIGDKLSLTGGSLTATDLVKNLNQIGIPENVVGDAKKVLDQMDLVNYSGTMVASDEVNRWMVSLEGVAKEVEKRC